MGNTTGIYGGCTTTHSIAAGASLISELAELGRGRGRERKEFGKERVWKALAFQEGTLTQPSPGCRQL